MTKFKNEQVCRDYLVQQRWNGKPVCPYCGDERSYIIEGGKRFKCGNKECYKKYSVTVGTIFEASNIPLSTWFAAMYIITAHKKGISSVQLAKDLGVTQKTAWFILHRIRESLKAKGSELLTGVVEADETYMGRKFASDYVGISPERAKVLIAKKLKGKGAVLGAIQRNGEVRAQAADTRNVASIANFIKANVSPEAKLYTDESPLYTLGLKDYDRQMVNHSQRQWAIQDIHTNNIEAFWAVMKRGIYGIYHQISYKHLQRYCDEFTFRYNNRKIHDGLRFTLAIQQVEVRLKYVTLINGKSKKERDKTSQEAGE